MSLPSWFRRQDFFAYKLGVRIGQTLRVGAMHNPKGPQLFGEYMASLLRLDEAVTAFTVAAKTADQVKYVAQNAIRDAYISVEDTLDMLTPRWHSRKLIDAIRFFFLDDIDEHLCSLGDELAFKIGERLHSHSGAEWERLVAIHRDPIRALASGLPLPLLLPLDQMDSWCNGCPQLPSGWHNIERGLYQLELGFGSKQTASTLPPSPLEGHLASKHQRADKQTQPSHSPDFNSVNWFGLKYTFTQAQARIVEVLWRAWESNNPDLLYHPTIQQAASVDSARLPMVFDKGKHVALGTMIISTKKGSYRLQEPRQPEELIPRTCPFWPRP